MKELLGPSLYTYAPYNYLLQRQLA